MKRGILGTSKAQLVVAAALLSLSIPLRAPAQVGGGPTPPPSNSHLAAPIDLTGDWVAVVTEDWRYRMITPDRGDYAGVNLTPEGHKIADNWDPAKDEANGEQCKSYGAAGLMRVPTRVRISWENDTTLKVETDAGTQAREFHFGGAPPPGGAPTWQGYSVASWEGLRRASGGLATVASGAAAPPPTPEGYLQVITTQMRPGYLRKNGVPYGAKVHLEEYFDTFKEPNGDRWLVVTGVVTDPQYLLQPYLTSSHFKKIPDGSGWNPAPCEAK
jgi:hypothetical protein